MTEVCINGHTRTKQNTSYHKDNQRNRMKRVCLDCKTAKRERNGKPTAVQLTAQRTTDLHEDVEDLLRFGATYEEIITRAGFTTAKGLRQSLRRRERFDLLEQLQVRKGDVKTESSSVIPCKPNQKKKFASSERGEWIATFN